MKYMTYFHKVIYTQFILYSIVMTYQNECTFLFMLRVIGEAAIYRV